MKNNKKGFVGYVFIVLAALFLFALFISTNEDIKAIDNNDCAHFKYRDMRFLPASCLKYFSEKHN